MADGEMGSHLTFDGDGGQHCAFVVNAWSDPDPQPSCKCFLFHPLLLPYPQLGLRSPSCQNLPKDSTLLSPTESLTNAWDKSEFCALQMGKLRPVVEVHLAKASPSISSQTGPPSERIPTTSQGRTVVRQGAGLPDPGAR